MATQTLPIQKQFTESGANDPIELDSADVRKLIDAGICPDCRSKLTHECGCKACHACGFSVC